MSKSTKNSEFRIAKRVLAISIMAALATQVQAQQSLLLQKSVRKVFRRLVCRYRLLTRMN